jgi:exodeoxyribonuclease-3
VEIDGLSNILAAGYHDVFRVTHPDKQEFTYWNYMFNARARNVGWRIDYFLARDPLLDRVDEITIHNEYMGSDHCPVEVVLRNA